MINTTHTLTPYPYPTTISDNSTVATTDTVLTIDSGSTIGSISSDSIVFVANNSAKEFASLATWLRDSRGAEIVSNGRCIWAKSVGMGEFVVTFDSYSTEESMYRLKARVCVKEPMSSSVSGKDVYVRYFNTYESAKEWFETHEISSLMENVLPEVKSYCVASENLVKSVEIELNV